MEKFILSGNYRHPTSCPANAVGRAGGSVAGFRPENLVVGNLMALSALVLMGNFLTMCMRLCKI
jgi:hypothetical protein